MVNSVTFQFTSPCFTVQTIPVSFLVSRMNTCFSKGFFIALSRRLIREHAAFHSAIRKLKKTARGSELCLEVWGMWRNFGR